ncbi:MAG: sulfite exporter TauE/SafE family protein [Bacteroidales bacterium]|nr:sulfite exporter TauE/SafE family protein [Bacteroidales bacterium]RKX75150.1 MAG: sulfite exporter TauE/SafE family protein [Spirochaetota bacterium]RKX79860.1 MAG: sulfite exporter TauE/SafE family protein [Spirochaetota bacterium]RKX88214.1 MAG: sulfite exporter TauE/SafE family protein [Spirochaetota bacterium]RKX95302.1 MAG: sulfite exporter TauE/SafE family protein [Spirochaetota bacterium]
MLYILAGVLTLPITTILTIAGVGAAFILIPVFTALGVELHEAMAVALLLNALAMIFASFRYGRKKLILWKISIPFIITSCIGAPVGALLSYRINNTFLRLCFILFLLFASAMIFFYKTKQVQSDSAPELTLKSALISSFAGLAVGFISGLIGVGGGNIVLPILIALGIKPKEAVATTALIVIFSSFSAFISHLEVGTLDIVFVSVTAGAAILGAIIGSWLMTDKLKPEIIKKILGFILIAVAVKMIINLI